MLNDRVMFFSMHRYEHGIEWPHMRESDYDYVGEGAGRGFNFNIPLNEVCTPFLITYSSRSKHVKGSKERSLLG